LDASQQRIFCLSDKWTQFFLGSVWLWKWYLARSTIDLRNRWTL